tara:strand:+ start:36905 stop:37531 length:627 start_codon:yes stop_codon:yes gene_type:complete
MFIRAYLRASTQEQDAGRAKTELIAFVAEHGHRIASFYFENESGATLQRPELMRLINDASEGDVILVEQIDRLARLNDDDWQRLKRYLSDKRISIVSKELPTSWIALDQESGQSDFTATMIRAINTMMLDMLAVIARKDYEDRRRRQQQGIEKAQQEGRYKGKPENTELHEKIRSLLIKNVSYNEIVAALGCSRATVAKVSRRNKILV